MRPLIAALLLLAACLSARAQTLSPEVPDLSTCAATPTPECLLEQAIYARPRGDRASAAETELESLIGAVRTIPIGQDVRDRMERNYRRAIAEQREPAASLVWFIRLAGGDKQAARIARDAVPLLTPIRIDPDAKPTQGMKSAVRVLIAAGLFEEAYAIVDRVGDACGRLGLLNSISFDPSAFPGPAERLAYRQRLESGMTAVVQAKKSMDDLVCKEGERYGAEWAIKRLSREDEGAQQPPQAPPMPDVAGIKAEIAPIESGAVINPGPLVERIMELRLRDQTTASALFKRLWAAILKQEKPASRRAMAADLVATSWGHGLVPVQGHEAEARRAIDFRGSPFDAADRTYEQYGNQCRILSAVGILGMVDVIEQLERGGSCGWRFIDPWDALQTMVATGHDEAAVALLERKRKTWDWARATPAYEDFTTCGLVRPTIMFDHPSPIGLNGFLALAMRYPECRHHDGKDYGPLDEVVRRRAPLILERQAKLVVFGGWIEFVQSLPAEVRMAALTIALDTARRRGETGQEDALLALALPALGEGCKGSRQAVTLLGIARLLNRPAERDRLLERALTGLAEEDGRCALGRQGYVDTALALQMRGTR